MKIVSFTKQNHRSLHFVKDSIDLLLTTPPEVFRGLGLSPKGVLGFVFLVIYLFPKVLGFFSLETVPKSGLIFFCFAILFLPKIFCLFPS